MAREKTGDQRRRERLRHYRREYVRLKTRLREIGFICEGTLVERWMQCGKPNCIQRSTKVPSQIKRSEEHTSELQSRLHLVCRLLLEKKKKKQHKLRHHT